MAKIHGTNILELEHLPATSDQTSDALNLKAFVTVSLQKHCRNLFFGLHPKRRACRTEFFPERILRHQYGTRKDGEDPIFPSPLTAAFGCF